MAKKKNKNNEQNQNLNKNKNNFENIKKQEVQSKNEQSFR